MRLRDLKFNLKYRLVNCVREKDYCILSLGALYIVTLSTSNI